MNIMINRLNGLQAPQFGAKTSLQAEVQKRVNALKTGEHLILAGDPNLNVHVDTTGDPPNFKQIWRKPDVVVPGLPGYIQLFREDDPDLNVPGTMMLHRQSTAAIEVKDPKKVSAFANPFSNGAIITSLDAGAQVKIPGCGTITIPAMP